jgi:hypothetical protein
VGRAGAADAQRTAEYDTFEGEAVAPRQGVSQPTAGSAADEAEYRRSGTVALQALRPGDPRLGDRAAPAREPPPRTAPPKRRRRRRGRGATLLALAIVVPLLIAGWLATRAVYFVGTDPADADAVTIFRGLPYELPFGVRLYERYYESGVTLADVPARRRASFVDHRLRSRDDAETLVIALEKGQIE